jgi:hypothetical protein
MQKDLSIRYLIHKLLKEQDFIIVPGFGAFMVHPAPAHLDSKLNEFIKPQKSIQFNTRIQQNDGVLAHAFSLEFGLSIEESFQQIQNEIKRFLTSKTPIDFIDIGVVTFQLDGGLDFIPHGIADIDESNFGLDNLFVQPIQIHQPVVIALPTQKTSKKSNTKYISYAAASLVMVLFSLFSWKTGLMEDTSETLMGWTYTGTPTYKAYDLNLESFDNQDIQDIQLMPGDRISLYYWNSSKEGDEGVFLEKESENSTKPKVSEKEPFKHTIVIAAFSQKELATNYCDAQIQQGNQTFILPAGNHLFLIGMGNFQDRETAQNQVALVQAKFPRAWVK